MSPQTRAAPTMTMTALLGQLEAGAMSAQEAATAALDAAEDAASLNAFTSLAAREVLLARARKLDDERAQGLPLGPLAGVPIAIKDNLCVAGMQSSAASKMLQPFIAPYDATAVAKLRQAGALIVGKANMDEFGMGSSSERSWAGAVRNPHAPERTAGGSSGGSAAAVAAGITTAALGTDTGGSIRQPAAHCGLVGIKPTYGRVSRHGLIAYASSLDQVGPMTRTVEDAARVLQVIAGHDPRDMTSARLPVPSWLSSLRHGVEGLRIGLPVEVFEAREGADPVVFEATQRAIDALRGRGATIHEVSLPHLPYAIATYYLIATAEASSNLARHDGVRHGHRAEGATSLEALHTRSRSEGFGDEVKRRILLGTFVLSSGFYDAYFSRAQRVRARIARDYERALTQVDLILTPTTPAPAPRLGITQPPMESYLQDVYTVSCNLAGLPGISVPCGQALGGLPLGVQLVAGQWREDLLFRAGQALEDHAGGLS